MSESGLLVVDKPGGMTSHDVVARVRRILGTRKVGHAGTLDPLATGVLIVGVERATRLLGHLALKDKAYSAVIRLGASTLTDDAEGEVLRTAEPTSLAAVTSEEIASGVAALTGAILQRPTAVSAIKVDGRRAYERVRAGEPVELAARPVVVSGFDVLGERRGEGFIDLEVHVECSTGTYIRALARDLGDGLGVGGHLVGLRRTRVGPFGIDRAIGVQALQDAGATALVPMETAAPECFATWLLDEEEARAVAFGQRIVWRGPEVGDRPVALMGPAGGLMALAVADGGVARYLAVLA